MCHFQTDVNIELKNKGTISLLKPCFQFTMQMFNQYLWPLDLCCPIKQNQMF